MSEYLRASVVSIGTAAFVGSVMLTGCSTEHSPVEPTPTPTPTQMLRHHAVGADLPRCYDKPLPTQQLALPPSPKTAKMAPDKAATAENKWLAASNAWEKANFPPLLKLHVNRDVLSMDLIEGDPIEEATAVLAGQKAVVQVRTSDWEGTGFVVRKKNGKEAILTAAHVAIGDGRKDLTVTADDGSTAKVKGGCYIYETDGKNVTVNPDHEPAPPERDVAVLELTTPLKGVKPLDISAHNAKRGSWVQMVNYQTAHSPTRDSSNPGTGPAEYTGIAATGPANEIGGYQVVTGLSVITPGAVTNEQASTDTTQPGCSGGPAMNSSGEVIGMTTSGTNFGFYDGADNLKTFVNMVVAGPVGGKSGRNPVIGGMQTVQTMEAALDSPRG